MNKKFVNTRKAAELYTHTHTHTHTHTDSFLKSLKQIGTICFTISLFTIPNFASADNIPTTNPGCTTTVLGAQNIANGSASLEPDFSANTINTTWYSNGTQLTGDNIPGTCTYDNALTPPTPAPRAGYVFGGWTLKPPACEIPSSLVSTNGNAYAAKRLNGGSDDTYGGATYGITQPGEWGVSWENGDKVVGEAICSQTSGTWATTGTPDTTGTGETQYCWCKATHYTANNAQQCTLSSPAWVFYHDYGSGSAANCAYDCAGSCARLVRGNSGFRAAIFTGLVAQ